MKLIVSLYQIKIKIYLIWVSAYIFQATDVDMGYSVEASIEASRPFVDLLARLMDTPPTTIQEANMSGIVRLAFDRYQDLLDTISGKWRINWCGHHTTFTLVSTLFEIIIPIFIIQITLIWVPPSRSEKTEKKTKFQNTIKFSSKHQLPVLRFFPKYRGSSSRQY